MCKRDLPVAAARVAAAAVAPAPADEAGGQAGRQAGRQADRQASERGEQTISAVFIDHPLTRRVMAHDVIRFRSESDLGDGLCLVSGTDPRPQ